MFDWGEGRINKTAGAEEAPHYSVPNHVNIECRPSFDSEIKAQAPVTFRMCVVPLLEQASTQRLTYFVRAVVTAALAVVVVDDARGRLRFTAHLSRDLDQAGTAEVLLTTDVT